MDILITTLGILAIYALLISLGFFEELGIIIALFGLIAFSTYLWNHYDLAVALVIR